MGLNRLRAARLLLQGARLPAPGQHRLGGRGVTRMQYASQSINRQPCTLLRPLLQPPAPFSMLLAQYAQKSAHLTDVCR